MAIKTFVILPHIELEETIEIGNVIFEPKAVNESPIFQIYYDYNGNQNKKITLATLKTGVDEKNLTQEVEKSVNILSFIFDFAKFNGLKTPMFLSNDNFQYEIIHNYEEKENGHLSRYYGSIWESVLISKTKNFAPNYIRLAKISFSELRKRSYFLTILNLLSEMTKYDEYNHIFTAIKWFNKCNTNDSDRRPSEKIVNNAIALEALLKTPNNGGITDALVYSVKMFVKDDKRLEELVRQFYRKRGDVVHKGVEPELYLIENTDNSGVRYGSVIHFAYLLFNACLIKQLQITDLVGILGKENYQELFFIDREYKEAIESWLESNNTRFKKIIATKTSEYFSKDSSKVESAFSFHNLLYSINELDNKSINEKLCWSTIIDLKKKVLDILNQTSDEIREEERNLYEGLIKDLNEIDDGSPDIRKIGALWQKYVLKINTVEYNYEGEYFISFLEEGIPRANDYIGAMEKIINLYEEIHHK